MFHKKNYAVREILCANSTHFESEHSFIDNRNTHFDHESNSLHNAHV